MDCTRCNAALINTHSYGLAIPWKNRGYENAGADHPPLLQNLLAKKKFGPFYVYVHNPTISAVHALLLRYPKESDHSEPTKMTIGAAAELQTWSNSVITEVQMQLFELHITQVLGPRPNIYSATSSSAANLPS
jgi:hypothetical protein